MKYLLLAIILTPTANSATKKEIELAKTSIKSLIQPLIKGNSKKRPKALANFSVEGCEKKKVDWLGVLTMKTTVTLDYKFKEGCDIQGSVTPKVFQPFLAEFSLRDVGDFKKIQSQNRVTSSIRSKPTLKLNMTSGVLTGPKGDVKFEADYKVQIDPLRPKDLVQKNLGGEIRIYEIYGQKVSIIEKVFVE